MRLAKYTPKNNGGHNKLLDVRAKQLLFKIYFGKLGVVRIRFRPASTQSLDNSINMDTLSWFFDCVCTVEGNFAM